MGELCWDLGGIPVVPLSLGGSPCAALPYVHRRYGEELRAAGRAAFVSGDRALIGPIEVTDDVSGDLFNDELITQELLKYPPSRALADSILLRRENWWWLPRMIVRLARADEDARLAPRAPGDPLLIRTGPKITAVSSADWSADPIALKDAPAGRPEQALIFGHRYTVPDMERWEVWRRAGLFDRDSLHVESASGDPPDELPPLRLLERMRRHRALERGCRRGIAIAEAEGS